MTMPPKNRKCKTFVLYLFAIALVLIPVKAQEFDFALGGYGRYLFSSIKTSAGKERRFDHLLHFRLNSGFYAGNNISAALELRSRTFWGNSLTSDPAFAQNVAEVNYPLDNLDAYLWENDQSLSYLQIDRLLTSYDNDNWQLTLGRQRIAWGTSLVWNVIDVFNPKNVLDIDYTENPGADALRWQYFLGPLSQLDIAWKPGNSRKEDILGLSYSFNNADFDYFLLTGIFQEKAYAGAAFSGQLYDGGFRGELMVRAMPGITDSLIFKHQGAEYITSLSASYDYTFPNSLYLHFEFLYNNIGETDNIAAFQPASIALNLLSPGRYSAFVEIAYDITPLVRIDSFFMANPFDGSFLIFPFVTYSLSDNADLLILTSLTSGAENTEFNQYDEYFLTRLSYSF
jgi:hypothetical protein